MRIVFCHPPAEVPRRAVNFPGFAPLGPLTAAGWLEAAGHEVAVWEALAAGAPATLVQQRGGLLRLGPEPPLQALLPALASADMVVFPLDMFRHPEGGWGATVRRLTRAVKARRASVATVVADCYVGGVDSVPVGPTTLLEALPDVDAYVRGEPELALAALAAGAAPATVPGVHARGVPPAAEWAAAVSDLDDAPPPAWHLVDVARFVRNQAALVAADLVHEYHGRGALLPAMSSRGCPYGCSFCASGAGRRHRALSPAAFRRHLDRLLAHGADTLFFLDDVMNLDLERFKAVMRALAEAKVAWTAANGLRADRLDAEAVELFRDSGGFGLKVSAESGDPRVLREIIGKGLQPEDARRAAALAAAARVPLMVHYVIGFPGEGVAGANRTLDLAAALHDEHGAEPRVQFATPVPGTPLHDAAAAAGHLRRRLSRTDLLAAFVDEPTLDPPDLPAAVQRLMLTLLRRRLDGAKRPVLLLDPTWRCNQQCRFCSAPPPGTAEPDDARVEAALRAAAARGARRVDLGGGEPTIHPRLTWLVGRARDAGLRDVGVVTNGRTLAAGGARALRDAGVGRLMISVPAHTEELAAAVTGVAEGLRETLAGLDAALALDFDEVSLNLVACRATAPHLAAMVAFLGARFAVRVINLQVALPLGRAVADGEAFDSYEELLPHLRAAVALPDVPPLAVHNLPACFLPERPGLALAEVYKGDRVTLEDDGLVPFTAVLARALGQLEWCVECPVRIVCPGMDRRMHARYAAEAQRPRALLEALLRATPA